jgi:uncharacterized YigZ family protein
MTTSTYKTLAAPSQGEFKDRGSKFIAYAYPVYHEETIKAHVKALKKEHAKAVHHCYAWRLGLDKNRLRTADDGEPNNSAGRPILGQIDSLGLTNILVVVVRYFGGTLLGVPGLINAYKSATLDALEKNTIITQQVHDYWSIDYEYQHMNTIMSLIKHLQLNVVNQDLGIVCQIQVRCPLEHSQGLQDQLSSLEGVSFRLLETY